MPPTQSADALIKQRPLFACRWRLQGREAASVRASGEVDIATAPQLDDTLREALAFARLVLVDLQELSFMDSTGLRVLLDASVRAHAHGGRIVLAGASAQIESLLDLTGARAHLDVLEARPPREAAPAGPLLRAVTETMVALHLRHHGRAPATAETHLLGDDVLACRLGGISTEVERSMIGLRRTRGARDARGEFQAATRHTFIEAVERLTGRAVAAFVSNYRVGPDLVVELFLLEDEVCHSGSR